MASSSAARSLGRLAASHVVSRSSVAATSSSSSSSSSTAARLAKGPSRRSMSSSSRRAAERTTRTDRDALTATDALPAPLSGETPSMHLPPLARKNPQLYQAVRPAPRSAYVALANRLKLISSKTDAQKKQDRLALLVRACTHPTFALLAQRADEESARLQNGTTEQMRGKGIVRSRGSSVEETALDQQYIQISPDSHNASMASLGNALLGIIATEFLHLRYPNLPTRVLKAGLSAYVGTTTLSDVSAELGVTAPGLVRWDRKLYSDPTMERLMRKIVTPRHGPRAKQIEATSRDAFADALRSIVALLFQEQGLASARQFVHLHLLSRLVPFAQLLKFNRPKHGLSHLMKALGKEGPQSRLIAETGRLSANAVFVVGIWSGQEKLGEGTGSALRMAEYRAAEDALRRFYLSGTPAPQINLPSITLDSEWPSTADDLGADDSFGFRDVWSIDEPASGRAAAAAATAYQPAALGMSEVVFENKG